MDQIESRSRTVAVIRNVLVFPHKPIPLLAVIVVVLCANGCGGGPVGSRLYRPISASEEAQLSRADRRVYPGDIRTDSLFGDTIVAWPGVITDIRTADYGEFLETTLLIEHRYFLWVEHWKGSPIPYTLSPRGEGTFETTWRLTRDAYERRLARFEGKGIGNLVIVYGRPRLTEEQRLVVDAAYIREIDRKQVRTESVDFGRDTGQVEIRDK